MRITRPLAGLLVGLTVATGLTACTTTDTSFIDAAQRLSTRPDVASAKADSGIMDDSFQTTNELKVKLRPNPSAQTIDAVVDAYREAQRMRTPETSAMLSLTWTDAGTDRALTVNNEPAPGSAGAAFAALPSAIPVRLDDDGREWGLDAICPYEQLVECGKTLAQRPASISVADTDRINVVRHSIQFRPDSADRVLAAASVLQTLPPGDEWSYRAASPSHIQPWPSATASPSPTPSTTGTRSPSPSGSTASAPSTSSTTDFDLWAYDGLTIRRRSSAPPQPRIGQDLAAARVAADSPHPVLVVMTAQPGIGASTTPHPSSTSPSPSATWSPSVYEFYWRTDQCPAQNTLYDKEIWASLVRDGHRPALAPSHCPQD